MKKIKSKKESFITSSFIKKAVYYAAQKHDGQYRKGLNVPYFVHPFLVALGVSQYTHDENVVAAAILHDLIEDCQGITKSKIEKEFGKKISRIVSEVTCVEPKNYKNSTWRERKQFTIDQIKAASNEALLVITSDKITNMKGYFEFADINGRKKLSKLFNGTLEDYFWYYKEILVILKSKLPGHPIVKEYQTLLNYFELKLRLK